MKLRNKKTGESGELHYYPDKAYHFTVSTKDPTQMGIYKTLGEVLQDWTDFIVHVPAEPLIDDLKHYVILSSDEFETLTAMAAKAQAVANKQRKAARRTNATLTPQQLSDRNRKAAIARWNKVKNNNLIKDIK